MAYKIIRPRHGIKSLWNTYKSRIYKLGEMLVESPESGVGSGPVNIKFGDGVTDYEKLPYAVLAPVDEVSEGIQNPVTSDSVAKALKNVNIEVVDNLESTSDELALSANMGRELNNKFGGLRLGEDGDGNGGYYKGDDTFVPFKQGGDGIIHSGSKGNYQGKPPAVVDSYTLTKDGRYLVCIRGGSKEQDANYCCAVTCAGQDVLASGGNGTEGFRRKEFDGKKGDVVEFLGGNNNSRQNNTTHYMLAHIR